MERAKWVRLVKPPAQKEKEASHLLKGSPLYLHPKHRVMKLRRPARDAGYI
jgi:hypothetical protein